MSDGNWIKLYRSTLKSDVFENPNLLKVWVWCLCKASHKDRNAIVGMQAVPIQAGQFIFGRKTAAEELHMTESMTFRCMKLLEKLGCVNIKANNKFSVVTIEKWGVYQSDSANVEQQKASQREQQMNNKRTTNEQQMNTDKNVKNVKNVKNIYGDYNNVRLTDEEFEKLKAEYPDYKARINRLSEYMASTGKTYKNHLATIRAWARRDEKDKPKPKRYPEYKPDFLRDDFEKADMPDDMKNKLLLKKKISEVF